MLRSPNELQVEQAERLRDGEGVVTTKHLFTRDELTGKARLVAETIIPPGASIGFHRHVNEEEIYYILSGQGQVIDDTEIKEVGPGFAMLTGGGEGHSIINTGNEPLVFMAVILLFE